MDISINKNIEYSELKDFLGTEFADLSFFLIYEGLNDWEDIKDGAAIVQYGQNNEIDSGFKYSLSIYVNSKDPLPLIENIASRLAHYFDCASICDASRVVLKDRNYYYSLLFEAGKVYLVDDSNYEELGTVAKIVELAYKPCPARKPEFHPG